MSKIERQVVTVPGEGRVICTISVLENAAGVAMSRALTDARRVDGQRLSEDGRKTAGRLARAYV